MSSGKSIAQNAAWLMLATTGQKVLAFLSFTIAARTVGPFVTGEYFYSVAVTSTFVVIADLGLTPVVIRAIAAGAEEGKRFLGAALRIKSVLIPVAVLLSIAYVVLGQGSRTILITTAIATLVMSADAVTLVLYGALRGTQRLQFEAFGMFMTQALTAIVAVSAALLGWGAPGLAFALLVGSLWNVAWSWIQTNGQHILPEKPTRADVTSLVRQAIPFALAGIFVKVYSYLDSLMLKAFHGEAAVGAYSVAYKVTYAFQFIPLVFVAALFPAMSSVHADGDEEKLKRVFAESLRLMVIIGAPLAAGLSAIAPRFVPLVYDLHFLGAVPALSVLPWVLLPIFIDFPIGSLLNATHRAHLKTAGMGATMVVNALANAFLVPLYGPFGAAIAGVISFWFLLFIGLWFVWRELPSGMWVFSLLLRALMVSALTWLAVRLLGASMPFPLMLLFGGGVGVSGLLITKLLTFEDCWMAVDWMKRRVKGPDPTEERFS